MLAAVISCVRSTCYRALWRWAGDAILPCHHQFHLHDAPTCRCIAGRSLTRAPHLFPYTSRDNKRKTLLQSLKQVAIPRAHPRQAPLSVRLPLTRTKQRTHFSEAPEKKQKKKTQWPKSVCRNQISHKAKPTFSPSLHSFHSSTRASATPSTRTPRWAPRPLTTNPLRILFEAQP